MQRKHVAMGFLVFCLTVALFLGVTTRGSDIQQATQPYDPWYDVTEDGAINILDILALAVRFGSEGQQLVAKAGVEYDSGWVDISDQYGQSFNLTHNLNSTDLMVDITGKIRLDSGVHQRSLGGTGYTPGWSRTYGGADADAATCVIQTNDGGYATTGYTQSLGAGNSDGWLVKTDAHGNIQWNHTYGGADGEVAECVVQTDDGGYALAGHTLSFGVGIADFWLVKTDADGAMEWNHTYGGTSHDYAYSAIQTDDGGYALAGYTTSFGAGGRDFWLVKTDPNGAMEWSHTYGGTNTDGASSVVQKDDGGYVLMGYTVSFGVGQDAWLVRTDASGNHVWNQTYGGSALDAAFAGVESSDGGYALAGYTYSFGVDVYDCWLVKTDANGAMEWNQTYGGTGGDRAFSVVQTDDGGYAIAGFTYSFGAGSSDGWLVKTDADGAMEWNQTYGGTDSETVYSVVQADDGGYAMAGRIASFGAGNYDFWLIKTGVESGVVWMDSTADTITLYRGATDAYWNYVRVRIWTIKESP